MNTFIPRSFVPALASLFLVGTACAQDFVVVTSTKGYLLNGEEKVEKIVPFMSVLDVRDKSESFFTVEGGLRIHRALVHYSGDFDYMRENVAGARQAMKKLSAAAAAEAEPEKAVALAKEALAEINAAFPERTPASAWFMQYLAYLQQAAGDLAAAHETLDAADSLLVEIGQQRHQQKADLLNVRGLIRLAEGDHEEALRLQHEALLIVNATLGDRHLDGAIINSALSHSYEGLGNTAQAVGAQLVSIRIHERSLPASALEIPKSYARLGTLCHADGQYQEAINAFETAAAMYRTHHADQLTDIVNLFLAMGDAYEMLGEIQKAEDSYLRGTSDLAGMAEADAASYEKSIINRQGLLDFGREQYDQALVHFYQAEKLSDPLFPTRDDAQTWEHIGSTHAAQDDYKAAKGAFVKALKIYAKVEGETSDSVLHVDKLIINLDGATDGSLDDVVMVSESKAYMFDDDKQLLTTIPELTVLDWNAHADETDERYGYYTVPYEKEFGNIDETQLHSARMLPGYFDANAEQFKTAMKSVAVAWKALVSQDAVTATNALADAVTYCKSTVGEKSTLTLWVQMFQIRVMHQTEGPEAASAALSALQEMIDSRLPGDYPIEMNSNSVAGELLFSMNEAAAAAEKFREARDIAVDRLGADHVDVMNLNQSLAEALLVNGNISDAEKTMRETLRIAEEIYPPNVSEVHAMRLKLCRVLTQTESLEEALQQLQTLTDASSGLAPQPRIMAFTLSGRVMALMGRTVDAREVFFVLLRQLKEMEAETSPPAAMIHADLGRMALGEKSWADAVDHLTRSTSIQETIGTSQTFEGAQTRLALARAFLGQEDEPKAVEQLILADETFTKIKRTADADAKETAALLKTMQPNPSRESMKPVPETRVGNPAGKATRDTVAEAIDSGRFEEAKRLCAERLTQEIRDAKQPTFERAAAYLGLAKLSATDDIKTFDSVSLSNAIDDFRKLDRRQEFIDALLMQAYVFIEQDEARRALELLDFQILNDQSALSPKQLLTGLCFRSRALAGADGAKEAVDVARKAHQLAQQEFGQSHIYCHSALEALGHGLLVEGDKKAAAEVFNDSREILLSYLNETVVRKSYPELVSFLAVTERSLHDAVAPLWGGETMEQALTWVLNEKNLLAELSARPKQESSGVPQVLSENPSLFQELMDQERGAPAERKPFVERPDEPSEFDEKLSSEEATAAVLQRVSVADVRNALKPDELLIEFVYLAGENDTYIAWMIPPTGEKLYLSGADVELGIILDFSIENSIPTPEQWMKDIQSKGEIEAVASQETQFGTLVREFWGDLARRIPESTKTIIFSLDGSLQRIPWAAMPGKGNRMLVEDYGIRFVSSGRELVQRATEKPGAGPSLVMADPDFNAQIQNSPTIAGSAVRGFPRIHLPVTIPGLPGTALEANAILPDITRYAGSPSKQRTGADATESAFFGFRRPHVLHIATHSLFLKGANDIPQSRAYELTESRILLDQKFHELPDLNPLSRCGLLLAGCNTVTDDASPADGILTGQEIVFQDMDGTELVVLSGCPSDVNKAGDPYGPALLPIAFRLAGARTVVAPIWNVPDRQTTTLMISFYQNLANGMTKTEALRQAQLSAIKKRKALHGAAHPYYWASFRIYGVE